MRGPIHTFIPPPIPAHHTTQSTTEHPVTNQAYPNICTSTSCRFTSFPPASTHLPPEAGHQRLLQLLHLPPQLPPTFLLRLATNASCSFFICSSTAAFSGSRDNL